jgi:hypothetical protein
MRLKSALAVVALGASLAACDSIRVDQLDREFVDIYKAKVGFQEQQGMFGIPEGVDQQFAELSDQALAEAGKLGDDKIHQKIGFLRVAAFSAWQAGPKGKPNAPAIAGNTACMALEKTPNRAQMPRDCAIIRIAEPLARKDNLSRELAEYLALQSTPNGAPKDIWKPRLIGMVEGLSCQTLKMTRERQRAVAKPIPSSFWQRVDRARLNAFCDARNARAEFAKLTLDDGENRKNRQAIEGFRKLLPLMKESYPSGTCRNVDEMAMSWRFAKLDSFSGTVASLGAWPPNCPVR